MSNKTDRGPRPDARQLLVEWANGQDHWVRRLAAEVLATRSDVSAAALDELFDSFLREKQLADGPTPTCDPLELSTQQSEGEEPLILLSVKDVKGVNALASNQELRFNARLTILFGENGAGKTGYVRILKTAAAIRSAEPILSNVFRPSNEKPSASITYRVGTDAPTEVQWAGERGVHPLSRIDVFDSRGFIEHVDGELTYSYTPGEISLFRFVAKGIEQIKGRLDSERERLKPQGNPFLPRFSRDSKVFSTIETLGASTNLDELRALAAVTESEANELQALRDRVDALQGRSSADKLKLVRSDLDFYRRMADAVEAVQAFEVAAYVDHLSTRDAAQDQQRTLVEHGLATRGIKGLSTDGWSAFILAAEEYIRQNESADYPHDGADCVYCLQPLTDAARELVATYRALSNSDHERLQNEASKKALAVANRVQSFSAERVVEELAQRDEDGHRDGVEFSREAHTFLSHLTQLQCSISNLEALNDFAESAMIAGRLQLQLASASTTARNLEATLVADVADRDAKLKEETERLRLLEARLTVRELLPSIEEYVSNSKWVEKAATVGRRFQPLLKSLTDATKLASERLLNDDFEECFRKECGELRAPEVTLEFPGRKGEPARKKTVSAQHRVSEVLSEGEQKVIGLADFLAETALRHSASPLVFDDPVNSLDYKRLSYLVDRIAALSDERQVIVFTHNIWFTMELLSRFEKAKDRCSYFEISQNGDDRGIVSLGSSPRLDSWNDRKKRINVFVERARGETDKVVKDAFIEKAYEELRGACEIVVEQDLLKKVVQSYTPNVMVGNLREINVAALPAAIDKVGDVFDRCCRIIASHKQPLETLNIRPTLSELETDWRAIQDVHLEFSK